jgi:hypothetical protein
VGSGALIEADSTSIIGTSVFTQLDPFKAHAGQYYVEFSGASRAPLAIGGSIAVAGVPEMSTWAMLGLGFASLGFAGTRKREQARIAV